MGTALSCLLCLLSKLQLEYHSYAVPVPLCHVEKIDNILTACFLSLLVEEGCLFEHLFKFRALS